MNCILKKLNTEKIRQLKMQHNARHSKKKTITETPTKIDTNSGRLVMIPTPRFLFVCVCVCVVCVKYLVPTTHSATCRLSATNLCNNNKKLNKQKKKRIFEHNCVWVFLQQQQTKNIF